MNESDTLRSALKDLQILMSKKGPLSRENPIRNDDLLSLFQEKIVRVVELCWTY